MIRLAPALAVGFLVGTPTEARADETQLGAFLGPRFFSQESRLGYIDRAPAHPMLENAVAFGARVAREFGVRYLLPEFELAFCPTKTTTPLNAIPATVYWINPRAQLRLQWLAGQRFQPFAILGGGAPIAISSARRTLNSGIIGEGFVGGGVRLDTGNGFTVRLDARISIIPGANPPVVSAEAEIGIGIEVQLGRSSPRPLQGPIRVASVPDRDGDGIPDASDRCGDRPEDIDQFEDDDGCPDIDNDGDQVLDIADKCATDRETNNGFEDEDGCPDAVPAEVAALKGTIGGLIYAAGETTIRSTAVPKLQRIASVMNRYPSLIITLVGHSDDREANAAAPASDGAGSDAADALAVDLSRARADAVRQALSAAGIAPGRMIVEGAGSAEPVATNATPKGRLANRRVQVRLIGDAP